MMFRRFWMVAFATFFAALPASAEQMASPTGPVLLQVSGQIDNTNSGSLAEFDWDMLRALDWREIQSYTSFTEGEQTFAGPSLASVLAAVGASGSRLNAQAINDYYAEIPTEHATQHQVILAMTINGKPMRIRDKGPIWVIYPMTEEVAAQKPYDSEMVWQLNRIQVLP